MVADVYFCPHCQQSDTVIRFGFNRCGTQKLKCRACRKTFTPLPKTRSLSLEKEQMILATLAERVSLRAIARTFKVSRNTVTALLEKK